MSETEKFTRDILSAAQAKSQDIITQAEQETQKALEEAKIRLSNEADGIVQNAKAEAENLKRRLLSEARHKVKLQEQHEKDRILSEVLEETRKKIGEMAIDEKSYIPYLVSTTAEAIRELGLPEVLIRINNRDLKQLDMNKLENAIETKLPARVKIVWSKESIEAIGGAIVSNLDGKIRINSTLDQKFQALESKLLTEAGRLLFRNNV